MRQQKDTDKKLDVLKDENHRVKKLITNQVTDSLLEDVQSTANSVKQNIEKSNESVVRRLHSISDAMKQFTQKTNPQTTENTFYETEMSRLQKGRWKYSKGQNTDNWGFCDKRNQSKWTGRHS